MKTVVVTLTDQAYFHKVKRTIQDVRSRGEWMGDLVLITVGFDAPQTFMDFHRVTPFRVEHLDTSRVIESYRKRPIRPTDDNREWAKLTQWDKFYVFDRWFLQWDRVIFLDAGLRVLDKITWLSDLDCEGVLMAPDDAPAYDHEKRFYRIIEADPDRHPETYERFLSEYSPSVLNERYFLNCIWMYDTQLLHRVSFQELVDTMNKFPFCRCNEMTVMNLLFTFKYRVWKPFPEFVSSGKRLFGWTEHDRDYDRRGTWRDFCFLKYPFSISFDEA